MPAAPTRWVPNRYPEARRSDHVDVYKSESKGEVRVHDPYEWLEHNTPETEAWTIAQEQFTREYLDQNPDRQELENQIRKNMDYARFSAPSLKDDGRWYWYYNTGLQAQSVLYRSKDGTLPDFSQGKDPGGEVFFDPNLLSSDGTAALAATAFARSGKHFAYGISRSGSDFFTIYVRPTSAPLASVQDGNASHDDQRLPEEIRFVKFSGISWTHDSKGFFYQRFPSRDSHGSAADDLAGTETQSDKNAMLYYHRLGTQQTEDVLVYKDDSEPEWMWGTQITELDGRYLLLSIRRDTSRKNLLWIADLEKETIGQNMRWDKLINEFDANYEYIANDGTKFYFLTNKDAPMYKLVAVDIADPVEKRVFDDIIPEDKKAHLQDVLAVNIDHAAVVYKHNVIDEIYVYQLSTGKRLTRLAPDFVGAASVNGRRSQPFFFSTLTGFTNPGIVARYNFEEKDEDKRWSIYRTTLVSGLDPNDFSAEQVWYNSKDGTRVPMFIVRHKDTEFDGTAAALQYGYGGFTISVNPFFSPAILTWMQKYGAILAVPNIRGGGEFGEEWHLAGTRERKVCIARRPARNLPADKQRGRSIASTYFIAATQYLVDNKYAAPGKVAINGGSNGDADGSCWQFADFTIGRAWTSDYGDPHNPHDFDFIYPISPLHNIPTDKTLPPFMLTTADHDDRVVPLHSFKHAATLQHLHPNNPHPLIIRIDKKAGHGAGKSTEMRIREYADKYGFISQSLGLPVKKAAL
ncbi:hypothetical protein BN946_scf185043.g234 [Trametes cinnabarina]|uniref:Prolyl endopeptidase n=1 Tax=Pycnoporus cinnabarinus TaxID=5643 RepID=A0A060SI44_PYCCI|nr:hypothetical protein BN946_scf185043.g234 [Trametes cinnabarina]